MFKRGSGAVKNLKEYQKEIIAFCLAVFLALPPSLVLSVGMSFIDTPLAYATGEVPVLAPAGESSGAEQSFDPASVGSEGSSGSSTTTSGGNIDYGPGGYIVDGALSAASGSDSNYSSDGSNYSSDGSSYSSDGSSYSSEGSNYSSDGSNYSSEGSNYSSDGSNYSSDGSNYSSDGSNYSSDGSNYSSEGSNYSSDGSNYSSEGSTYSSDGSNYSSDGSNYSSGGSNYSSEGSSNGYADDGGGYMAASGMPDVPPAEPRVVDGLGRLTHLEDPARGVFEFDWASGTATLTDLEGTVTKWGGIRSDLPGEMLDRANVAFDSDWRYLIAENVRGYLMLKADGITRLMDSRSRPVLVTHPAVGTYALNWKSRTVTLTDNSGIVTKTWGYLEETRAEGREIIVDNVRGFRTFHEAGGITNYMDENGDVFRRDTPNGIAKFLYDGQHHVIQQWNPAGDTFDFTWGVSSESGAWVLERATLTKAVAYLRKKGDESLVWINPSVLSPGTIYTEANVGGQFAETIRYDRSDPANIKISVTSATTGETVTYTNCYIPIASEIPSFPKATIPSTTHVGTIAYVQVNAPNGGWYRKSFGTSLTDITRVDYSNGDSIVLGSRTTGVATYTATVTHNGNVVTYAGVRSLSVSAENGIEINRVSEFQAFAGWGGGQTEKIIYSGSSAGLLLREKSVSMNNAPSPIQERRLYHYDQAGILQDYQLTNFRNGEQWQAIGFNARLYTSLSVGAGVDLYQWSETVPLGAYWAPGVNATANRERFDAALASWAEKVTYSGNPADYTRTTFQKGAGNLESVVDSRRYIFNSTTGQLAQVIYYVINNGVATNNTRLNVNVTQKSGVRADAPEIDTTGIPDGTYVTITIPGQSGGIGLYRAYREDNVTIDTIDAIAFRPTENQTHLFVSINNLDGERRVFDVQGQITRQVTYGRNGFSFNRSYRRDFNIDRTVETITVDRFDVYGTPTLEASVTRYYDAPGGHVVREVRNQPTVELALGLGNTVSTVFYLYDPDTGELVSSKTVTGDATPVPGTAAGVLTDLSALSPMVSMMVGHGDVVSHATSGPAQFSYEYGAIGADSGNYGGATLMLGQDTNTPKDGVVDHFYTPPAGGLVFKVDGVNYVRVIVSDDQGRSVMLEFKVGENAPYITIKDPDTSDSDSNFHWTRLRSVTFVADELSVPQPAAGQHAKVTVTGAGLGFVPSVDAPVIVVPASGALSGILVSNGYAGMPFGGTLINTDVTNSGGTPILLPLQHMGPDPDPGQFVGPIQNLPVSDLTAVSPTALSISGQGGVVSNVTQLSSTQFTYDYGAIAPGSGNYGGAILELGQDTNHSRDGVVEQFYTLPAGGLVFGVNGVTSLRVSIADNKVADVVDGKTQYRSVTLGFTINPGSPYITISASDLLRAASDFNVNALSSVTFIADETSPQPVAGQKTTVTVTGAGFGYMGVNVPPMPLIQKVDRTVADYPSHSGWTSETVTTTTATNGPPRVEHVLTTVRILNERGQMIKETGPDPKNTVDEAVTTTFYLYDANGFLSGSRVYLGSESGEIDPTNGQPIDAARPPTNLIVEEFYSSARVGGADRVLDHADRYISGRRDSTTFYDITGLYDAEDETKMLMAKEAAVWYANGSDRPDDLFITYDYYRQDGFLSGGYMNPRTSFYQAVNSCWTRIYTTHGTTAAALLATYRTGTLPDFRLVSTHGYGSPRYDGQNYMDGGYNYNLTIVGDTVTSTQGSTIGWVGGGSSIHKNLITPDRGTYELYDNFDLYDRSGMVLNGFEHRWGGDQTTAPDGAIYSIAGAANNTYLGLHDGHYFAYSIYVTSNLDSNPPVVPAGSTELHYYYVNGPRPGEIIKVTYAERSDVTVTVTRPRTFVPAG